MRLQQYLLEDTVIEQIDYKFYLFMMDNINSPQVIDEGIMDFFGTLKDKSLGVLKTIISDVKKDLIILSDELKVGIDDLVDAFKNKNVFHMLKAFGFNLGKILKGLTILTGLVRNGLFEVFKELHNTKLFQQLHKGTVKIDDILDKYPILKKIGGIGVAALLFYMWTQMTFIGDFKYDFDFTSIGQALRGSYSIADLFSSPAGLMLIGLFASGGLISVAWLGSSSMNLILVLLYHSFQKVKNKDINLGKLKRMITIGKH